MMKEPEVILLVRKEVESIKKRDGELPKTAYLLIEIASRLKTVTNWEGRDPREKVMMSIRKILENILKKTPTPISSLKTVVEDDKFSPHPELGLDVDWSDRRQTYDYVKGQLAVPVGTEKLRNR